MKTAFLLAFSLFSLIPGTHLRTLEIHPVQEQRQRLGAQPQLAVLDVHPGRPGERPLLQPLDADPQAGAVEVQQLDPVPAPVREDEQRALPGILPHLLRGQRVQAAEALAHVRGLDRQVDLQPAGDAQHDATRRMNAACSSSARRFLNRNTLPSGRATSTARSRTAGGTISTSANPAPQPPRPLFPCVRSHFESVTALTPLARQNAACVIPLPRYLLTSSRRSLSA